MGRQKQSSRVCCLQIAVPTQNSISSIERPLQSLTQLLVSPSSFLPRRSDKVLFLELFFFFSKISTENTSHLINQPVKMKTWWHTLNIKGVKMTSRGPHDFRKLLFFKLLDKVSYRPFQCMQKALGYQFLWLFQNELSLLENQFYRLKT